MKIILVQCPAWGRQTPPLALACLTAYLREYDKEVVTFDFNNELFHEVSEQDKLLWQLHNESFWIDKDCVQSFVKKYSAFFERVITRIVNSGADIIGFSVFTSSRELSLFIANEIKSRNTEQLIVFGGPDCMLHMHGKEIMSHDYIDVMVIGEGEETLKEIAEHRFHKHDVEPCCGAWVRQGAEMIFGGKRKLVANLNNLPFANFSDFDLKQYDDSHALPIYLSRGCINRCVYCGERLLWQYYRCRNGETVAQEISSQLEKNGDVTHFDFVDSAVNGNYIELEKFADSLISRKIKTHWSGQAIIKPYMTFELLCKLKESGCNCLSFGIESGSQHVLDRMRKSFSIEIAEKVIRDAHRAGICVVTNFMFGFPGECEEDFEHTIEFILRNHKFIDMVNPSPAYTAIGAETYLFEHPEEFNLDLSGGHALWKTKDNTNTYQIRKERYLAFCRMFVSLGMKSTYKLDI